MYDLLDTGLENSLLLESLQKKYKDIPSFLSRTDHVSVRSTIVGIDEATEALEFYTDIDGVIIEWNDLSATSHIFNHLFIMPRERKSLRPVYSWLKKHENIGQYSVSGLSVFQKCVGVQLLNENGWEYVLALLPQIHCNVDYSEEVVISMTFKWIGEVRENFRQKLIESIPGMCLKRTLDKNNINDVSQLFIVTEDSSCVLETFQRAIDEVVPPTDFRKFIFSYKFGDKNRGVVNIPTKNVNAVASLCVHVGVSFESVDDSESLFWSRNGLSGIVGRTGTLVTCLSIFECANYQSSMSGSVPNDSIRRLCRHPESVHFVQFYADISHRYPKTRYHPVSGSIIVPEGLKGYTDALVADAKLYISEAQSNFLKVTKSVCRLEFVLSLPEVPNNIEGSTLISIDNLKDLLCTKPLLVPFAKPNIIACIRQVGGYLCETLTQLLDRFKGTCSSEATWQAYQCELAIEKLLWGHPLNYLCNQYSINLGIGVGKPSRCSSDKYGFLRLENPFSCCVDETTTPPLSVYSKNAIVKEQISKVFGFWDFLDGSELVIGKRLISILLNDLYTVGNVFQRYEDFLAQLKTGGDVCTVRGVITKLTLAQQLSSVQKCKFPMVYSLLLRMLRKKHIDIEAVLLAGIEELQLVYFPSFRERDLHNHQGLFWLQGFGVWIIKDLCDKGEDIDSRAKLLCALVVTELEKRKLCFTRSLTGTNETFPWVKVCLRKLDQLKLKDECLLNIMTFVTCIAFVEGGRFVDYNRLHKLEGELPFRQSKLRALEIQSKFLVNNFNKFMLWRLHHSVPRISSKRRVSQVNVTEPPRKISCKEQKDNADTPMLINADIVEDTNMRAGISTVDTKRHLPSNTHRAWSNTELLIVVGLIEKASETTTMIESYMAYQRECHANEISDRSLEAFRCKYRRLAREYKR